MKPMGDGHGSIGLLQALFFFRASLVSATMYSDIIGNLLVEKSWLVPGIINNHVAWLMYVPVVNYALNIATMFSYCTAN